jgi:hypothetical protein
MKYLLTIVAILLISFPSSAQKKKKSKNQDVQKHAIMSFAKSEIDIGTIKDSDKPVTHIFRFTNTGNAPLQITKLQTTCGCTTPEYSDKPVLPGREGIIKVAYDPKGKSGRIDQSVIIVANTVPNIHILRLKGNVHHIQKKPSDVDFYPIKSGNLRFATTNIQKGEFYDIGIDSSYILDIYNESSSPVMINRIKSAGHINIIGLPTLIPGKASSKFMILYDTKQKNSQYGFVRDTFELITTDPETPVKFFTITGFLKQDFSNLTPEEFELTPRISFQSKEHNFGTVHQKESYTHEFKFVNTGKQRLYIYKMDIGCGCTATFARKKILEPGESSEVFVTYTTDNRLGFETKDIVIHTNDPTNPTVILSVRGNILKSKD